MSRTVDEWEAANDDQAIPARVKVRIFERFGGKCAHCTRPIVGKLLPAYDHCLALVNGGKHAESNLQLLCVPCHAIKSRQDVALKAKNYRVRRKHAGIKPPRKITRWRRFDGTIREAGRER